MSAQKPAPPVAAPPHVDEIGDEERTGEAHGPVEGGRVEDPHVDERPSDHHQVIDGGQKGEEINGSIPGRGGVPGRVRLWGFGVSHPLSRLSRFVGGTPVSSLASLARRRAPAGSLIVEQRLLGLRQRFRPGPDLLVVADGAGMKGDGRTGQTPLESVILCRCVDRVEQLQVLEERLGHGVDDILGQVRVGGCKGAHGQGVHVGIQALDGALADLGLPVALEARVLENLRGLVRGYGDDLEGDGVGQTPERRRGCLGAPVGHHHGVRRPQLEGLELFVGIAVLEDLHLGLRDAVGPHHGPGEGLEIRQRFPLRLHGLALEVRRRVDAAVGPGNDGAGAETALEQQPERYLAVLLEGADAVIAMGAGQGVQQRQLDALGRERSYVGVAAADGLHGDADVGIAADGIADPYRQDVETGAHRGGAQRYGRLGVQGPREIEDSCYE